VPLLVFIHGLGGSAAQFNPVLLSLSNLGSCLAIDLPGCGVSSFAPKAWEAYTTESLVRLLAVVIEAHRAIDEDQDVILIGHSMGCSLAALLASPSSPYSHLVSHRVAGLIAICPQSDPPTEDQIKGIRTLSYMPPGLFSILRRWDRRNGIRSKSVLRMAGPNAEEETKKLQLRFNKQSRSAVWQRMALGMCPRNTTPRGGLPGQETWEGLDRPIFLIGGEVDQMTPVENVRRILAYLGRDVSTMIPPSEKASLPIAAAPFNPGAAVPPIIQQRPEDTGIAGSDSPTTEAVVQRKHQDSGVDASDLPKVDNANFFISADANTTGSSTEGGATTADALLMSDMTSASTTTADIALTDATTPSHPAPYPHRLVVKSAIMPKPASHSLLFAPSTSRIISGLISSFLADHIDPRLSLAWQLQYLSTEGKWDVKNLLKWRAVQPVSSPIANTFRAMKTLREVDETHTPKVVAAQWSGRLSAVIDISHDNPVYDPKGLEDGGILYQKFPTVSKQPPQPDEVQVFIDLVDKIRAEGRDGLIGVHCHYGFNRTGFFLVSYMVERLGYRVEDAIDEFQTQRPPGIRHSHFIDTLHVRYCRGLRKAPTL
jgi:pimeloyl-ACP methyl ester carboxylesterase